MLLLAWMGCNHPVVLGDHDTPSLARAELAGCTATLGVPGDSAPIEVTITIKHYTDILVRRRSSFL